MTTNIPATNTLRPGLLVALNTNVKGNVSYVKRDLEAEHETDAGLKAKWETERTIADAAEFERASQVRSKARSLITAVCTKTAFGLLCPESGAPDLDRATDEARKLCEDFNRNAKLTRVHCFVLTGRVASDDVKAVQAISGEVRDLIADMKDGLEALDVEKVRKAANEAKQIGNMLSPEAQARIQIAIDAVRAQARKIVAAGETAAIVINQRAIATLNEARTAFLDLEPAREVAEPVLVGRDIDLDVIETARTLADEMRERDLSSAA